MKLKIRYATRERKYLSEVSYQNVARDVELDAVRIERIPCGTGAAAERYKYRGYFNDPGDAAFVNCGLIDSLIDRKLNPQFKPKKLEWTGNVCLVA